MQANAPRSVPVAVLAAAVALGVVVTVTGGWVTVVGASVTVAGGAVSVVGVESVSGVRPDQRVRIHKEAFVVTLP